MEKKEEKEKKRKTRNKLKIGKLFGGDGKEAQKVMTLKRSLIRVCHVTLNNNNNNSNIRQQQH